MHSFNSRPDVIAEDFQGLRLWAQVAQKAKALRASWTKVFADARLAKAVVDRLTHKAHIIETGEESWRFRHGLARREKGKK